MFYFFALQHIVYLVNVKLSFEKNTYLQGKVSVNVGYLAQK